MENGMSHHSSRVQRGWSGVVFKFRSILISSNHTSILVVLRWFTDISLWSNCRITAII